MKRKKRSKIWLIPTVDLITIVKNNNSISSILKFFNLKTSSGNYTILKNRLKQDEINYDHIKLGLNHSKGKNMPWLHEPQPLEEILIKNSTYSNRTSLKKRLINDGLLILKCYECESLPIWRNKKLSLQLDHINGINDDHRLSNLRLLCPNCHSQTNTFSGRNIAKFID